MVDSMSGMNIMSFFDPFSLQVWLSILVAYVLVSLLMFIIARVTPYERHAPRPDPAHNFTLANSFWYTLSAFFLRSTPISPRVSKQASSIDVTCHWPPAILISTNLQVVIFWLACD